MMYQPEEFRNRLEKNILVPGIERGIFKTKVKAPVRLQKLHKSAFGKFLGNEFDEPSVMIIDYYGFIKRSLGFMELVEKFKKDGIELRSITVPVAYFAAIKVEHISDFDADLLKGFAAFKRMLVTLRQFHKS